MNIAFARGGAHLPIGITIWVEIEKERKRRKKFGSGIFWRGGGQFVLKFFKSIFWFLNEIEFEKNQVFWLGKFCWGGGNFFKIF